MKPKGKLIIIGGAENLIYKKDIDNETNNLDILRALQPKSHKHIEVITSGTTVPDKVKKIYEKVFYNIGYNNRGFLPIQNKHQANQKSVLKRVEEAEAVFFTGGDQLRLAKIINHTKLIDVIKNKYYLDPKFLVAGTSAGAMAMSSLMISGGGLKEALFNEDLNISQGLGFINNCIIDTHFIKRGRFSRLAHAVILKPNLLGLGLGEDTALIFKDADKAECRGSGMVVIIDGKPIKQTNMNSAKHNEAIYVENLKVHLLVRGCTFLIKSRKLVNPKK